MLPLSTEPPGRRALLLRLMSSRSRLELAAAEHEGSMSDVETGEPLVAGTAGL